MEQPFECPSTCDAIIYDGAALVNVLQPKVSGTFHDYAIDVSFTFIQKRVSAMQAKRVDIVWDRYNQQILKSFTRTQRGDGVRRQVKAQYTLPRNWPDSLRNSSNKVEPFGLLAKFSIEILGKTVPTVSTNDDGVLCSPDVATNL